MFALMIALYFYSSVWIYAFIRKSSNDVIQLQLSFIFFSDVIKYDVIQSTSVDEIF